jgi:hypothetical protein
MSARISTWFYMITQPSWWLAGLVLAIAFLYSSVGFGGASGYLAVMAWFDFPINVAVSTALILNLIVSGIAFVNYYRYGHFVSTLLWPFVISSIPAAFIGGMIRLDQSTYLVILHVILFYVAVRMLFYRAGIGQKEEVRPPKFWVSLLVGAGLGLLAGMIGIGGGIFLSPIIILSKWGNPKHAAATAAGFIFLNSIGGLMGRVVVGKFSFGAFGFMLIPIGVIGSLVGSTLGARYLSGVALRRILGVILTIAVIRFGASWL